MKELPNVKLMLMEPFLMIGNEPVDEVRMKVKKILPKYIKIIHALSKEYGTRLVRTQSLMHKLAVAHGVKGIGQENVHPNATGHLAIAEAVYKALSR